MVNEKEIYRLVRKNKEIIIHLLKEKGYQFLFLKDANLVKMFCDEIFVKTELEQCGEMKRGVMLSIRRDEMTLNIEKKIPNLKIFVMEDEYSTMERQLGQIEKKNLSDYLKFFGYSNICFEGNGDIINLLKEKAEHIRRAEENENILHITEYIDTRGADMEEAGCYLGIRQFLYELEVFSTFPDEITNCLENNHSFSMFARRFVDIFQKTGWKIVFSERTPFVDKLIEEKQAVCYLDNFCQEQKGFSKLILIENGNLAGVAAYYNKYKSSYWIVVRRFIILFRTWIMETLTHYFQKELEKRGVELYLVNWNWALNHPLFPVEEITSEQMEEREKYNLYKIRENQGEYHTFLEKIYREKYTKSYVEQVMNIPNKMELESGKVRHENCTSEYINIINGERRTCEQPKESRHCIYMLGGCVFFGYAVEDSETIASFMQKKLNAAIRDNTWKVVNMGTWGGNIDQTYKTIYDLKFHRGDIVVISYAGYMPLGEEYEKYDISTALNTKLLEKKLYFNSLVHCNDIGYEQVAMKLLEMIQDKICKNNLEDGEGFYLSQPKRKESEKEKLYTIQAEAYINEVKKNTPENWNKGTCGAIVMNCNPFTLGHQYLIRQSAAKVEHLYIFVVEEDKSFFPFKDRLELVKAGTKDLKNVVVIPSGKLIISSVTFPGYFLKDSPESVGVDTVSYTHLSCMMVE